MYLRININGNRAKNRLALIHLLKIRGIPYASETDRSIIIQTGAQVNNDREGINWIDMKPFFAMSSKARPNKNPNNPGWHLIVPIKPGFQQMQHDLSPESNNAIANLIPGETIQVNDLSNLIPHLTNPNQYSNRVSVGKNDMETTLFRTVSNRSDPNSWITQSNNNYQDDLAANNIKTINLDDNVDVNLDAENNNEDLANQANPMIGREDTINNQLNNLFNDPNVTNSALNQITDRNTPDFYDPTHQMSLF